MIVSDVFIAIAIANLILTVICLPLIIWALIELVSFKKSTHKIQYVNPLESNKEFDYDIDESSMMLNKIINSNLSKKEIESMSSDDDEFLT